MFYADLIQESCTTTGTGALTMGGAVTGYRAWSNVPSGTVVNYRIGIPGVNSEWEIGQGTWTTTLSRDIVLESSNANALVSLSQATRVALVQVAQTIADLSMTSALTMRLARN